MKKFSLYSNAPASDSMQAWVLGRISFTVVMISSLLRLAVSMFSSIIFVRGGPGSLVKDVTEGHKSVDNSGEGVNVRKLTW